MRWCYSTFKFWLKNLCEQGAVQRVWLEEPRFEADRQREAQLPPAEVLERFRGGDRDDQANVRYRSEQEARCRGIVGGSLDEKEINIK